MSLVETKIKKLSKKKTPLCETLVALNSDTKELTLAKWSIKKYNHQCLGCNQPLCLSKPKEYRDYFSHYPGSDSCIYKDLDKYSSWEHIPDKIKHDLGVNTLKAILESRKEIQIIRHCATGHCNYLETFKLEQINTDTLFVKEYVIEYLNENKETKNIKADLARVENGAVKEIYEIYNTHRTKEVSRPSHIPWYEFDSEDLKELYSDDFFPKKNIVDLYCIRDIIKCDGCVAQELFELEELNKKRKEYEKHLSKLELKIQYNPTNEFWKSLKTYLIENKRLKPKQLECLYRNYNVL